MKTAPLLLFAALTLAGELLPLKVFILAGQSNMAGRGNAQDLPPELRAPQRNILYYYDCSFGADRGPLFEKGGSFSSSEWGPLAHCRKHPSTPAEHFGLEITFGQAVAGRWPQSRIAIIKMGRGGTILAEDWKAGATTGKQLNTHLLNLVATARQKLHDRGEKLEIAGLVWMQGEGDTTNRERAQSYAVNLTDFLARLRVDLGVPLLPVVLGQIPPGSSRMLFPGVVRGAQRQVAAKDATVQFVPTDDLGLLEDQTHFSSAGLMELGRRCAAALPDSAGGFVNH